MSNRSTKKPRPTLRPFEVTIPTPDGTAVAERIPIKVPMLWDEDIQEWLLTPAAEEEIEITKARYMGLLQPAELRALRERFGLSQQAIGDLLQIGAKSWTRWETGRQRPSRSINLLLKALHAGMISPTQLRRLCQTPPDWSDQFRRNAAPDPEPKAVVIDLCRYRQDSAVGTGFVEPLKLAI